MVVMKGLSVSRFPSFPGVQLKAQGEELVLINFVILDSWFLFYFATLHIDELMTVKTVYT